MVFMVHKHLGADDDRWLYLPALDVVKRIAASDERTSFVGSHFFYEDVSGRGLDEDTHELVETTDNFYVLKNTPKDPSKAEFDSFKMYVHKATFIPVKVEFEKGGTVYRTAEALEVQDVQGHKTVTKSPHDRHQHGWQHRHGIRQGAIRHGPPRQYFHGARSSQSAAGISTLVSCHWDRAGKSSFRRVSRLMVSPARSPRAWRGQGNRILKRL